MSLEIIDFHTHPFIESKNNICGIPSQHPIMNTEYTKDLCGKLGITTICGSVIDVNNDGWESMWEKVKTNNRIMLELKDIYGDFYIPGYHVHHEFPEESINEMRLMHSFGINLIGELVPYMDGWKSYYTEGFNEILKEAARLGTVISIHSDEYDNLERIVKENKDVVIVAAHPDEYAGFMRHLEIAKHSENYYLDISGYGIFRQGMLRRAIDEIGIDRILFGSDYPTCNPAMYIAGVIEDPLIKDSEKEKILSLNAKRILGL